ncbi:MAG: hypothetical protein P4L80_00040 [Xanthobacteraceae bacterium]|nr:hypothetical protein [Xanthobacteraceae bacterium]
MAKSPKPHHRMKRPQPPGARPGRIEDDIKKALTTEQLAEIGAISLKFNQIESLVEFILVIVLDVPPPLWWEVVRRINGMDAKLSILRRYYESNKILSDEAKECLKNTLDAVADYKKYRDLIIHCVPYDIDKGIGQHMTTKAEPVQILLTKEALGALYERLCILNEELNHADLLFRLGSAEGAKAVYPRVADPSRLRRERDVPAVLALVLEHQNRRLSLPPLPEFPSEEQIQADQARTLQGWIPLSTLFPQKSDAFERLWDSKEATPPQPKRKRWGED